jgi:hypothetical protein
LVLLAHKSKRQLHDFAILSLWGFRQLIRWSVRGPVSCNPKINLVDALFRVASFDLSAPPFDMRVIPADVIALFYWAGWCDWLPSVHVDLVLVCYSLIFLMMSVIWRGLSLG